MAAILYLEKLENRTKHEPSPKASVTSEARDDRANPNETDDESRLGRNEEPSEARQGADVQGMKVSLKIWLLVVKRIHSKCLFMS